MKRFLGILSVVSILCTILLAGLAVSAAEPFQLNFTAQDMVFDTANNVFAKAAGDLSCAQYPGFAVVDTVASGGVAAVRKFVAPAAGPLKLAWGGGVYIDNGQGNLTGATVEFAVTDSNGKILFPTNGDVATVTEGTALEVSLDIDSVEAGDTFYFVVMNPSVDRVVCVLNFGVMVNNVAYSNGSGFLYADSTQGTNGWYHQYAPAVTKTAATDPGDKVVGLNFTEQEMEYLSEFVGWGVDGSVYETASWSNWGYVDQNRTNIRKLVMPRAGTFKIENIWGVTGVTVQNADQSFDFAILNKNKQIIWPTTGGMFHVTATTPAEVDLTLTVAAGDAVYFVFDNGSATPTAYTTLSVISLDDYSTRLDNGSGGYGAADITAQGNAGWYYMYATDLTEVKAKDVRDMTALNAAITTAETYTDLSGYTPESAAALQTALTAAISGLTPNVPVTLPEEDPNDPTVALTFTEQMMTYDSTLQAWKSDTANNCVITPSLSFTPKQNAKVAIRKFVTPVAGDLIIAWGSGISIDKGQANFVITNRYGRIVYPAGGGKVELTAGTPHELTVTFTDVEAGEPFYFIAYNQTMDGASVTMNAAVNMNSTSYAESGNFYNSANTQGAGGWYYVYTTDLAEVKKSAYKSLVVLNEQIAAADAISEQFLSLYDPTAVQTFRDALATAKALSEADSQEAIDQAAAALKAAIKALVPKDTDSNVNKVTFTEKEMIFNQQTGYWEAASEPSCIITEPLNYATPVTGSNTAAIRKLIVPENGSILLKWGNGVYIDNTSGNYTGATVEFIITDEDGNILYPQNGGAAKITEGTPLELDVTLDGLKQGDALYFITYNPSMANVPVVYNVGVTLNGTTALQTTGGSLYGTANEQGPLWYYSYADDLVFASAGGQGGSQTQPNNPPQLGENSYAFVAVLLLVFSASVLLLNMKFKKGEKQG